MIDRLQIVLAGLWAGLLLTLGAIAAPSAFAVLERGPAGLVAGRMFTAEAHVSVLLAVVLFFFERRRARQRALQTGDSIMSPPLLLVLAALFVTVLGHFALQPMIEAAKAGQGRWSFGVLHAWSSALFALKGVVVLSLFWRLTGRP